MMFVLRDFKAFYKQTILGPIWFFVQPLFTMGVYVFVFGNLAGLSTDGIPKPLFYLSGIICWTYFQDCLMKSANIFRTEKAILGKVYFPRIIMPLSLIISNLIRFSVQLCLFIIVLIYFFVQGADIHFSPFLTLFPLLVLCLALQGLGIGMIVSSLTTKYRDLVLLLTFGVQLLMYTTVVVYPLSSLSGKAQLLVSLNPVTAILEGVRMGFFGIGIFNLGSLTYLLLITIIIFVTGIVIFNKVERNFVDTI